MFFITKKSPSKVKIFCLYIIEYQTDNYIKNESNIKNTEFIDHLFNIVSINFMISSALGSIFKAS